MSKEVLVGLLTLGGAALGVIAATLGLISAVINRIKHHKVSILAEDATEQQRLAAVSAVASSEAPSKRTSALNADTLLFPSPPDDACIRVVFPGDVGLTNTPTTQYSPVTLHVDGVEVGVGGGATGFALKLDTTTGIHDFVFSWCRIDYERVLGFLWNKETGRRYERRHLRFALVKCGQCTLRLDSGFNLRFTEPEDCGRPLAVERSGTGMAGCLVTVGVILLLAAGAGAWYWWHLQNVSQ